eukprot:gene41510-56151_t
MGVVYAHFVTAASGTAARMAARAPAVAEALSWLEEDGATASEALVALLAGLAAEGPSALVVDLVEQGLDHATQQALIAHLRRRGPGSRPLFMLTRSCVILDLAAVGDDESIILCPANHSPPTLVAPYPGAAGYEAVATCLATPEPPDLSREPQRPSARGIVTHHAAATISKPPAHPQGPMRSPKPYTAMSAPNTGSLPISSDTRLGLEREAAWFCAKNANTVHSSTRYAMPHQKEAVAGGMCQAPFGGDATSEIAAAPSAI